MRIVLRLLCGVVIASAAITVWTRAALITIFGPQLTSVCLWIAAGGSMCAVITLAWTRKPTRRQQHKPPEPPAGYVVPGDRDQRLLHDWPEKTLVGTSPGLPRDNRPPDPAEAASADAAAGQSANVSG